MCDSTRKKGAFFAKRKKNRSRISTLHALNFLLSNRILSIYFGGLISFEKQNQCEGRNAFTFDLGSGNCEKNYAALPAFSLPHLREKLIFPKFMIFVPKKEKNTVT